jgi:hypothetical protein
MQVEAIGRENDPMTTDLLLVNLRDDCVSNMIVMFLRMITSAELQRRQEFFAPFIMVRKGDRCYLPVPQGWSCPARVHATMSPSYGHSLDPSLARTGHV